MKLNQLEIKTQLDIHQYNLGYIPDPPTDDEIYLYWGLKEKGVRAKVVNSKSKDYWDKIKTKQDYIEYAKKNCDPILPDDQEFIPRKYWAPIDDLIGEDLGVLYHPVWGLTRNYIFENFIPHSDTLVIQDCANKKPYLTNANYDITKKLMLGGFCDVAVCSIETIPLPFTIYYPNRMYDWAHTNEDSFMTESLKDFNVDRIIHFIFKFGYKKIIFMSRPYTADGDEEPRITEIKQMLKSTGIEVLNIYDQDYTKECLKVAKGFGILKVRYARFARNKLYSLLGAPKDFPQLYQSSDYVKKQNYNFDKNINIPNYEPPKSIREIDECIPDI